MSFGEVMHFWESGNYLVKGIHDAASATEEINAWEGRRAQDPEIANSEWEDMPTRPMEPSEVRHVVHGWYRWVPRPRDQDDDFPGVYLHEAKPHARGAFEATQVLL
jgi:hypothetical protein